MMFLLAAFEGVGSFEMLKEKGLLLAVPVSFALAFALLIFTAAHSKWGKMFCVALTFSIGGAFFDVFPDVFFGQYPTFEAWVFTIGVPSLGALLAFSKNK